MFRYILGIIIGFTIFYISSLALSDEIYKWIDKEGNVHFTDDPTTIPQEYKEGVEKEIIKETAPPKEIAPKGQTLKKDEPKKDLITDNNGHDEKWWKKRVSDWKNRLKKAEEDLEKAKNDYFLANPESQAGKRLEIQKKIKDLEKRVETAKDMLENKLPEEARKAGAPPGWLREK